MPLQAHMPCMAEHSLVMQRTRKQAAGTTYANWAALAARLCSGKHKSSWRLPANVQPATLRSPATKQKITAGITVHYLKVQPHKLQVGLQPPSNAALPAVCDAASQPSWRPKPLQHGPHSSHSSWSAAYYTKLHAPTLIIMLFA